MSTPAEIVSDRAGAEWECLGGNIYGGVIRAGDGLEILITDDDPIIAGGTPRILVTLRCDGCDDPAEGRTFSGFALWAATYYALDLLEQGICHEHTRDGV